MNVIVGESSFLGCRLVPWQMEEARGLLEYPYGSLPSNNPAEGGECRERSLSLS